jgi:pimeloyl-ACP methyl ester carboxylesterase
MVQHVPHRPDIYKTFLAILIFQPIMSKPSLAFLPGLLCDQEVWQYQMDALSDIAVCSCADWGSLDSIVAMAESFLATAPERFALAGHSMGGRVAFQVYRLAPQRVTRIALLNTGADARPAGAQGDEEARRRMVLVNLAKTAGMRAMAMQWLPPMMKPGRMDDTALVNAVCAMVERRTPEIFETQIRALLGRPDANALLGQINCPALLLSGREDGFSPPARHADMAAAIPGSKLAIIPDSGHMSPMEQPELVAQALREWLLM